MLYLFSHLIRITLFLACARMNAISRVARNNGIIVRYGKIAENAHVRQTTHSAVFLLGRIVINGLRHREGERESVCVSDNTAQCGHSRNTPRYDHRVAWGDTNGRRRQQPQQQHLRHTSTAINAPSEEPQNRFRIASRSMAVGFL